MATYTTSRIITVAVLAVALGTPAQPSTAATELPVPVFAGEQDAVAYEWMQGLFSAAGYEEPAVTVEFFDSEEACGGVRGRTWFDDTETTTIAVCATHPNPEVRETWRRRTLLHEMAHAWINENVGAGNTSAFTELLGLETWSSRDVKWEDRATEHAAEIFMWGIQDGDYNVDFRIDGTSCGELAAGYELLTGVSVACAGPAA
jgi:hypothetical protein